MDLIFDLSIIRSTSHNILDFLELDYQLIFHSINRSVIRHKLDHVDIRVNIHLVDGLDTIEVATFFAQFIGIL